MFTSIEAAIVRQNVSEFNYRTARSLTKALLDSGRVAYDQADKHNGGTAHILIDGEPVGQFSVLTPGLEQADLKKITGYWR
jgi:hypothetical protein